MRKQTHDIPRAAAGNDLPLHQFLTYRFARVQAKLNSQAGRILRDSAGITLSQWRIIAWIGNTGTTRPSELARDSALDKGLVSRNLKILIARGLIATKGDPKDHRARNLSLTASGRAVFESTLPRMQARQRRLRGTLDASELRAVYRILDKLEIAAEDKEIAD